MERNSSQSNGTIFPLKLPEISLSEISGKEFVSSLGVIADALCSLSSAAENAPGHPDYNVVELLEKTASSLRDLVIEPFNPTKKSYESIYGLIRDFSVKRNIVRSALYYATANITDPKTATALAVIKKGLEDRKIQLRPEFTEKQNLSDIAKATNLREKHLQ